MEEEIWIELIDEGAKGKYVSNFGNVMCDYGLKFSKQLSGDGYYYVDITYTPHKTKRYTVHRLVGKYFVNGYSEEKCDINHKDGDKSNNYYGNIEWVTHQENMVHSREVGLKSVYDGKGGSQLNEEDVVKIKIMLAEGYTHTEIAKQFDVTRPCITQIASGNRWANVVVDVSKIQKIKTKNTIDFKTFKTEINGEEKTLYEFSEQYDIPVNQLRQRYNKGFRDYNLLRTPYDIESERVREEFKIGSKIKYTTDRFTKYGILQSVSGTKFLNVLIKDKVRYLPISKCSVVTGDEEYLNNTN